METQKLTGITFLLLGVVFLLIGLWAVPTLLGIPPEAVPSYLLTVAYMVTITALEIVLGVFGIMTGIKTLRAKKKK